MFVVFVVGFFVVGFFLVLLVVFFRFFFPACYLFTDAVDLTVLVSVTDSSIPAARVSQCWHSQARISVKLALRHFCPRRLVAFLQQPVEVW